MARSRLAAALDGIGTHDVVAAFEEAVPCGRSSRFSSRRHAVMFRSLYQSVADSEADGADDWAARGRAWRVLGDHAAAARCLQAALALEPGHAYACAYLWELQLSRRGRVDPRLIDSAAASGAPRRGLWLAWRAIGRLRGKKPFLEEGALADLREAAALEPDCALAAVAKAVVEEKLNLRRAALASLARAVSLAPREGWIHQLRVAMHRKRGAVKYFGRDVEQAMWLDEGAAFARMDLGAADKSLRRYPRAYWLYVYRGDTRRSPPHNDFAGALADFRTALSIQPSCSWAWAHLSKALMAQGETASAAQAIDQAISLHQDCGWFYMWRGEIRRRSGALKEAVDDFDRGLRIDPDYELGYAWRGSALRTMGRLEEALADLSLAARLDPRHAWTLHEESLALRGLGRVEQSLLSLDAAYALDPKFSWRQRAQPLAEALLPLDRLLLQAPRHAAAWAWRGETLMSAGEPAAAVRSLRRGLRAEPDRPWALAWLGRALALCGRRRESLAVFDRALTADPGYSCAWAWRGRLQHERRRFDLARSDLSKAARLDPKAAWILDWLGQAREDGGAWSSAAEAYSASLRLHRGNENARSGLARSLERMGRKKNGRAGIAIGVLACAAMAATACAPRLSAARSNPRVDSLIAASEKQAESAENGPLREFSARLKECRDGFTVDQALDAAAQGRFDPYPGMVVFDLKKYYGAQAYARSDIGLCDKLAVVPMREPRQHDDWAQLCRINYEGLRGVSALLRGTTDFLDICGRNLILSGRRLAETDRDEVCRAYLQTYAAHGDPDGFCGMKALLSAGPRKQRSCIAAFRARQGDESGCRDSSDGEAFCRGVARFARAFARGDPSQCGDSTACWTLYGHEEKAQDYASRIATSYCRQRTSIAVPSQEVRIAADRGLALLDQARAAETPEDAASANGADSRIGRAERRWRQMQNAIVLESKTEPP